MSKIIKISLILIAILGTASCQKISSQKKISDQKILTPKEVIAANYFVKGTEDIPLLVDMEQERNDIVYAINRRSDIIYSSYKTYYLPKQTLGFYKKRLTEIGWKILEEDDNNLFLQRDDQQLKIAVIKVIKENYFITKFFLYEI